MIGYILSKFPALSTTFILNELLELEAQGVSLHVFSLAPPTDSLVHEGVARLRTRISYVPGAGGLDRLLGGQWRLLRAVPSRYGGTLGYATTHGDPSWLWRFLQAAYVADEARRLGLSHLHAHFAHHPATVAMLASRLSGIPFSFTAHAMDLFRHRVNRKLLARKMAAARFVATVSEFNVRFLREIAPGVADRIVLIPNGIDVDSFVPGRSPPLAPDSSSPFRIICVARLVEKKGIALLIEACRLLRDRRLGFTCEIVGEGVLRSRLEAQIKVSGLEDAVRLLGPATQEEVRERFRAAQAYVLPCIVAGDGDRDGLPVSLVEALASGLPVVSTPVTGIPEVVRDRHNGLLVPPGDAAALADAIAKLMTDPALYQSLAAQARPSVAARFDRRNTVALLRALLMGGAR